MTNEENSAIGQRLKDIREYLKISQEDAAKAAGVSRSAISLIESGARSLKSVELSALAKLYQHPVTYFLGEEEGVQQDEGVKMLARSYSGLSEADREELLRFSEYLAMRSKKDKNS